ncbi:hypothetical protein FRB95_014875 [Tulasnella sp. JGI-2019a]|nr:hypothetical protein FRB95_014875 [Tulasnella sp. JGI-2019a]
MYNHLPCRRDGYANLRSIIGGSSWDRSLHPSTTKNRITHQIADLRPHLKHAYTLMRSLASVNPPSSRLARNQTHLTILKPTSNHITLPVRDLPPVVGIPTSVERSRPSKSNTIRRGGE